MVERKTSDRFHTFHHFKKLLEEGRAPEEVWNDVLARHDLIKEWYEDRDLYHSIGYLVATGTGDDDLRTLIRESAAMTKNELREGLDAKIVGRLNLTRDQIDELEYDGDHQKCSRVLLLFNVESTRRLKDSFDRYPFNAHKQHYWSLEHIHAQNAEELVKKEQWQEWLANTRRRCGGSGSPTLIQPSGMRSLSRSMRVSATLRRNRSPAFQLASYRCSAASTQPMTLTASTTWLSSRET